METGFMGLGNTFSRSATLTAVLLVTLMAATSLSVACDDSEATKPAEEVDPNQPPAQIDLPSPPPASAFNIPEKNDDGTLRIAGLIHHQEKHLGNVVSVKGVIVQVLGDCDPKKAKKAGETCDKPHYLISDEEGAEKKLAVVGFERDFFDEAKTEVGQTHVFSGTYKKIAQGFVNSGDGLLLLDKLGEISVLEEK
jgi:hypothetical protein